MYYNKRRTKTLKYIYFVRYKCVAKKALSYFELLFVVVNFSYTFYMINLLESCPNIVRDCALYVVNIYNKGNFLINVNESVVSTPVPCSDML